MTQPNRLTDRTALSLHRERARKQPETFLHEEVADEVDERLSEINKSFTKPVLIGNVTEPFSTLFPDAAVIEDTETLDVPSRDFDLALHVFGLHWADDPVGQIVQCLRSLRPDGLFLAVLFGGETLRELRGSISEAEIAVRGGLSPRITPFGELRDLGALLQRAGAALPVADSRRLVVRYRNIFDLVRDLRGMGETNALMQRDRSPMPRSMLHAAQDIYRERYSDDDGYLLATFDVVYLTGWSPSSDQPKPLKPGSATSLLSDALGRDPKS